MITLAGWEHSGGGEPVGAAIDDGENRLGPETNNDITERKRAEKRYTRRKRSWRMSRAWRSERDERLIAHEVNQHSLLLSPTPMPVYAGSPAITDLHEARQAWRIIKDGNRASEVIRRVRALVKKSLRRRLAQHQ